MQEYTTYSILVHILLYREIKIGVGVWFVAQREVSPLAVKRLEAVTKHGITQYHAVAELLLGNARAVADIFAYFGLR